MGTVMTSYAGLLPLAAAAGLLVCVGAYATEFVCAVQPAIRKRNSLDTIDSWQYEPVTDLAACQVPAVILEASLMTLSPTDDKECVHSNVLHKTKINLLQTQVLACQEAHRATNRLPGYSAQKVDAQS